MSERDKQIGRAQATGDLGELFDRARSGLDDRRVQLKGEERAYENAAKKVVALFEHIDNDYKGGRLNLHGEEEIRTALKTYVRRASEICLNLGKLAQAEHLIHEGRVAQLNWAVELIDKAHKGAIAAAERMAEPQMPAPVPPAPVAPPAPPVEDEESPAQRKARLAREDLARRRAERGRTPARPQAVELKETPKAEPSGKEKVLELRRQAALEAQKKSTPAAPEPMSEPKPKTVKKRASRKKATSKKTTRKKAASKKS